MAEVNELSLSNLEGVTTPSISQETIQQETNDLSLSNLEGVKDIDTLISNELSLSNLEGVTLTKPTPTITLEKKDYSKSFIDSNYSNNFNENLIQSDEPTTREKIAYGLDKQNMFFGNVFRVAKAGIQAAYDPEKEFKEVALDNAKIAQADLYNRHEKFRGGKYDDDIEVLISEMATFLVDPYYLFMYATPWGRAMSMRQTGFKAMAKVAGLSAGTVSLDKLFDNLATTGEVNPKDIAQTAGIAGVLGPASMKAFQVIGKLLPSADKSKIAQIIGVIDGKTKTQLGVTNAEFKSLQKLAGDKEFLKLNKQLKTTDTASKKLISDNSKVQSQYYKSVKPFDDKTRSRQNSY